MFFGLLWLVHAPVLFAGLRRPSQARVSVTGRAVSGNGGLAKFIRSFIPNIKIFSEGIFAFYYTPSLGVYITDGRLASISSTSYMSISWVRRSAG